MFYKTIKGLISGSNWKIYEILIKTKHSIDTHLFLIASAW